MANLYLKAILTAAIPLVAVVGLWVNTGELNAPELWIAGTALVGAILVGIFPNTTGGVRQATKFIIAALTPIVSFLVQYALNGGTFDKTAFMTLVLGVLTAILVYLANNGNPPEAATHQQRRRA